jgi:hypothetical protein
MKMLFSSLIFLTQVHQSLTYNPLSDHSLKHLVLSNIDPTTTSTHPDPDFDPVNGALLSPILVPRVPDTADHARVQEHFISFVRTHLDPSWTVEWHNTTSTTPATGAREVPFQNLILRRDPPWIRARGAAGEGEVARLTLAAHYDSLYQPEGFVGAVDSAVPCALLLFVARAVDRALTRRWESTDMGPDAGEGLEEEKGVQILLLDGEEAWERWSDEDSLYGSR